MSVIGTYRCTLIPLLSEVRGLGRSRVVAHRDGWSATVLAAGRRWPGCPGRHARRTYEQKPLHSLPEVGTDRCQAPACPL
jgi:hypothetical protein